MEKKKSLFEDYESKIESWFTEENIGFEKIEPGFWGLSFTVKEREEEYPLGIVLIGDEPSSVKLLVELGGVPIGNQWAFFRKMLEMNFSEVLTGSFSINESNNKVYFVERIPILSLTKEQLLHSLDSVIFSVSELKPKLAGYII